MILLVLASGRGRRLKSNTISVPKPLVQINGISIIDYLKPNFKYFKKIIIISGYKSLLLKKKFSNYLIINNKNYKKTNMVESIFLSKNFIDQDVIISYSDIIFSKKIIIKMIKNNYSHIPLNTKWLDLWKKRMNKDKIIKDAEDVKIKKRYITTIGLRIKNFKKLPKFQFMGLARIQKADFLKLFKFYKEIKNTKIDFTNFLNKALLRKIVKLKYFKTSEYWYEIDSIHDLLLVRNEIKKI